MESLKRLFSPAAITVIGGGNWCESVVRECLKIGFPGQIWPVHPKKETIAGVKAYASIDDLPGTPDAAFIGVNRELTVDIAAALSARGCGGAVCFAAGFREASAELADGGELQDRLVKAAGAMRIIGPNCYGFVNALDGVALWPDVHGLRRVETGVAIIGQSSNVLINLTMQRRGLPIACVVAAGNQAQSSMATIGAALLEDPRITALGLHIEGINDLAAFESLADRAEALGKSIVALKVGRSAQAQAAAISHTASLAGSDAGARALLTRLGIAQVDTAAELVEALKLLHVTGGLGSTRIVSASCSGGEASLIADLGAVAGLTFPPLEPAQREGLRKALGAKVALANPLDYNTYIWGDEASLTACFTAMMQGDVALGCVILDFPRTGAPDWDKVVRAVQATRLAVDKPMALLSLLPEGLPEDVATRAIENGVAPLCGMADALAAIRVAAFAGRVRSPRLPLLLPGQDFAAHRLVPEGKAKVWLAEHGVRVPQSLRAGSAGEAAAHATGLGFPVVLKGEGFAHKSEAGAVILNLATADAVEAAAHAMPTEEFLVEQMVTGTVAELLVGVVKDPAHGFVLTLGFGGILTELVADAVSMLVPASDAEVRAGLDSLRCAALLKGYRGKPAADIDAVVAAIMGVQSFVEAMAGTLEEVEINPLMCGPSGAVAADALIRIGETNDI